MAIFNVKRDFGNDIISNSHNKNRNKNNVVRGIYIYNPNLKSYFRIGLFSASTTNNSIAFLEKQNGLKR